MIIKLDQNIDCTTLCRRIGKMLDSYKKENSLDNKLLSIKIVELSEQSTTKLIESKETNEN